jgi:hypothetical protein
MYNKILVSRKKNEEKKITYLELQGRLEPPSIIPPGVGCGGECVCGWGGVQVAFPVPYCT